MKKSTNFCRLMMILLLSSSFLFAQAQKSVSVDKAPIKKEFNEEQLKLLEQAEIPIQDLKAETLSDEDFLSTEKLLKDLKGENESYSAIMESSSYVEKILNPDESITVTLGTGTSTNTTTGNPTPYGTFYKNFRQQYLILASELIPLGIGPGDITAIGFNVANVNNCVDMPDYKISIKHTTASALITTFENDNFTEVFYAATFLPVVGWNTHTFSTPFTWDGTSNILLDICTTLIPGAYTQNASVYYTATTGTNTCLRYQSDTQVACFTTNNGTLSANRANMQITGEEMLNPPPGMPYNEIPINGSGDVAIDGDLAWTFGNNTENYDLWFGPAGAMVKVIDNQPAGATGTFAYSGLNYATPYNWQVVAMNVNGTTNGPVWNFSTVCGIVIPPFYEDFSTYTGVAPPPACWLEADDGDPSIGPQSIGTSLWVSDNFGNVTGASTCPRVNLYMNTKREWLISPHFDLSGGSYETRIDIALTDYANPNPATMGSDDQVIFLISPDAGATWDTLQMWDITTPVSNTGETIIISLANYNQSEVVFAFWANEGAVNDPEDYDFFIDNFKVQVPPTCPEPTALGVTNITGVSAALTWVSNSGLSDIEFGPGGFTPTGIPTHAGVTSPYEMTGLTPSTSYSFYIRDDCGGGEYSVWVGPVNFSTACATFTAPFAEHFQNTTIPLCWEMSGPQAWLFTTTWPGYGATGLLDHTGTGGSFAGVDGSGTISLTGITLLTPLIDVSALTVPQLRFYLFNNNVDNADWQTLTVDLWDGAGWNNAIYYWGTHRQ
jgi:hypothetical protein